MSDSKEAPARKAEFAMEGPLEHRETKPSATITEPTTREWLGAILLTALFVLLTRVPLARTSPFETDEISYLRISAAHWLSPTHTLFLAAAKAFGLMVGDAYGGFVALGMVMCIGALLACWWWLRALVAPVTAALATFVLAVAPLFWAYGLVAASYPAIIVVGASLLGIAWRTWSAPRRWHPYVAALIFALGAGYRLDIGLLWSPVLALILWRHRWRSALVASGMVVLITAAWVLGMVHDCGWERIHEHDSRFAYSAGYLNSVWNLGLIDAPVRYAVKLGMALVLTLGPALVLVPFGFRHLRHVERGRFLVLLLGVTIIPALGLHLLVHFGVPGYAFHYVPASLGLIALGASHWNAKERATPASGGKFGLTLASLCLAAFFLFYPTDFNHPGFRGDFDLAFARYTRAGMRSALPVRAPITWRTANSIVFSNETEE